MVLQNNASVSIELQTRISVSCLILATCQLPNNKSPESPVSLQFDGEGGETSQARRP